jgi:uncharacterized surface protein with fasciclin (FAS1) repeats
MKKLAALIAGAAVLIVAAGVASASPAKTTTMSDKNIVETAVAAGQFKTLATLVAKAGLAETLATGGTFTVFAPTDEAFAKVHRRRWTHSQRTPTCSCRCCSTTSFRARCRRRTS